MGPAPRRRRGLRSGYGRACVMSQDTEDLAARLAALEGTSAKKSGRARPSPMAALLGVGGIAAIGGLAWVALQPAPDLLPCRPPHQRSSRRPAPALGIWPPCQSRNLHRTASGNRSFGNRASPDGKPCHAASRTCRTARPSDGDRRRCGAEAIADLTAQIAALEAASAEAQRALERQLTERDRELDQLRMDLEVASLTPA
jgi:type IV secretion system protein VirB10